MFIIGCNVYLHSVYIKYSHTVCVLYLSGWIWCSIMTKQYHIIKKYFLFYLITLLNIESCCNLIQYLLVILCKRDLQTTHTTSHAVFGFCVFGGWLEKADESSYRRLKTVLVQKLQELLPQNQLNKPSRRSISQQQNTTLLSRNTQNRV